MRVLKVHKNGYVDVRFAPNTSILYGNCTQLDDESPVFNAVIMNQLLVTDEDTVDTEPQVYVQCIFTGLGEMLDHPEVGPQALAKLGGWGKEVPAKGLGDNVIQFVPRDKR